MIVFLLAAVASAADPAAFRAWAEADGELCKGGHGDLGEGTASSRSMPPPIPLGVGRAACREQARGRSDAQWFVTPVGTTHYDPTQRTRSGPTETLEAIPCGDQYEEDEAGKTLPVFRVGTTQQVVSHGSGRWTGHDDAHLGVSARMEGEDIAVTVSFTDDDGVVPKGRTPEDLVAADHVELWWTTRGFPETPSVDYDVEELEVHPSWGPLGKERRADMDPKEVAAHDAALGKARQLGLALVEGEPVAVWLFPEGLAEPPPKVRRVKDAWEIRLPKASLDVRTEGEDWYVPFTAVAHDIDGSDKATLVATSPLQWATPASFGQLRHYGAPPYDTGGRKEIPAGKGLFEVEWD